MLAVLLPTGDVRHAWEEGVEEGARHPQLPRPIGEWGRPQVWRRPTGSCVNSCWGRWTRQRRGGHARREKEFALIECHVAWWVTHQLDADTKLNQTRPPSQPHPIALAYVNLRHSLDPRVRPGQNSRHLDTSFGSATPVGL